jgi:hypothetical protein
MNKSHKKFFFVTLKFKMFHDSKKQKISRKFQTMTKSQQSIYQAIMFPGAGNEKFSASEMNVYWSLPWICPSKVVNRRAIWCFVIKLRPINSIWNFKEKTEETINTLQRQATSGNKTS